PTYPSLTSPLSLHDALPIYGRQVLRACPSRTQPGDSSAGCGQWRRLGHDRRCGWLYRSHHGRRFVLRSALRRPAQQGDPGESAGIVSSIVAKRLSARTGNGVPRGGSLLHRTMDGGSRNRTHGTVHRAQPALPAPYVRYVFRDARLSEPARASLSHFACHGGGKRSERAGAAGAEVWGKSREDSILIGLQRKRDAASRVSTNRNFLRTNRPSPWE